MALPEGMGFFRFEGKVVAGAGLGLRFDFELKHIQYDSGRYDTVQKMFSKAVAYQHSR